MIFNNNKIYLKVWKVTPHEKYIDIQATTSEKNKDGSWTNSRWFPRIIGYAFNTLNGKIKEGDKITVTKSKFTNETIKNEDGTFKNTFKFLILEADIFDGSAATEKDDADDTFVSSKETATASQSQTVEAEECPW